MQHFCENDKKIPTMLLNIIVKIQLHLLKSTDVSHQSVQNICANNK